VVIGSCKNDVLLVKFFLVTLTCKNFKVIISIRLSRLSSHGVNLPLHPAGVIILLITAYAIVTKHSRNPVTDYLFACELPFNRCFITKSNAPGVKCHLGAKLKSFGCQFPELKPLD